MHEYIYTRKGVATNNDYKPSSQKKNSNIRGTLYKYRSSIPLLLFYQKNKFPYEKFLEILILQPERPLHWICIDCGTELRDTYSTVTNLTKLFQIQILNNTSLCCCCSSSQLKRMIIKILM